MILSVNFKIKRIPRGEIITNNKMDEALVKKDEENPSSSNSRGGIWSDESNIFELFLVRFCEETPKFLNIEMCS